MVFAEVDMSNQVMNSWTKPTVLAIVQQNLKCSILLEVSHKSKIKQEHDKNIDLKIQIYRIKKLKI